METATFVPKLPAKPDQVGRLLRKASQIVFVVTLVLMPLFFIPGMGGLALFPKIYFVLFGSLLALLFMALVILRHGSIGVRQSPLLVAWWVIVAASLLSAFFAPNFTAALFGDALEIHTVGFLALLGLVMSLTQSVANTKRTTMLVYMSFTASAILVSLLFLARVVFGPEFLTFATLQNVTDTMIGSFNDLGLFIGCLVMMALVALAQLELPKRGLIAVSILLGLSLIVLACVNFYFVWMMIALFSLLLLMYVLTKDRFGTQANTTVNHRPLPLGPVSLIGMVFLVSAIFLVGAGTIGSAISNKTGINFIEIRPSLSATTDVLRQVYGENAVTGFGPNRFTEAWNLYKDPSINSTIFWSTPFNAGGGYISSWFVTTGILGVLAWVAFLGLFIYTGFKALLSSVATDTFWFFMGTISFVGGLYVWILSFFYVPGPTLLLLGAVCTGTLIVAKQTLVPSAQKSLHLLSNSKTGFVLIASVMIIIIGIFATGYGATNQATAAYIFSTAPMYVTTDTVDPVSVVSERIALAYSFYPTDTYARSLANYQLSYLNQLLSVTEPTAEQQQQFQNAISAALNASAQAIALKPTDARNWQMLGDIYGGLSLLNIEGAQDRAFESYARAEALDPRSPYYVLQKAVMTARSGNASEARRLAQLSLDLKPNFTDALYLLSQLDIAAGDIPTAIRTTESIISLEANNPGRYYQLGVLHGAVKNTDAAIAAFTAAITLNPSYANARYFLAEQYLIKGNREAALEQLQIIRDLNPENTAVNSVIDKINSGTLPLGEFAPNANLPEGSPVTTTNDVTTTSEVPETPLLTPVNTPTTQRSEDGAQNTATSTQP
ncbi:MAG: tetratricopeptide repeat protein [Patescibacteria group bacterium]